MKPTVKHLLSVAGLQNTSQKYMCAYYINLEKQITFIHVIETEQPDNSFLSPFGLPNGFDVPLSELNEALKNWLKTNSPEAYNSRGANDRIRDFLKIDTNSLLK